MRSRILASVALVAACAAMLPQPGHAASLTLADGTSLSINARPILRIGSSQSAVSEEALTYTIVDRDGRAWAGLVPGSAGASPQDVALAQNPVTGEVVLALSRPGRVSQDIAMLTWTGQSWSAPMDVSTLPADELHPLLAFRPGGDALIAWTSSRQGGTVLLGHFDLLGSSQQLRAYSFLEVGTLRQLAGEGGVRQAEMPRVAAVVGGVEALAAYLLVASGNGSPLSVVRVGLDAIVNPGGFGAAPVPVSFLRTTQAGSSGLTGRADTGPGGEILAPWRMILGGSEAWYWVEGNRVQLVTLTNGRPGRLVGFDAPASGTMLHVEAFQIARAELGLDLRRGGTGDLPAGGRRLR